MNPEERDDGPFVHIELTDTEGIVRAYDLRQYELDRHAEKGTPLYNTIVEACHESPARRSGSASTIARASSSTRGRSSADLTDINARSLTAEPGGVMVRNEPRVTV